MFRGRGRGGRGAPRKGSSGDAGFEEGNDDLDTAESPSKPAAREEGEPKNASTAARKLNMEDPGKGEASVAMKGAPQSGTGEPVEPVIPPPPPPYVTPKERKKARKGNSPTKSTTSEASSAASLEEDHRAQ